MRRLLLLATCLLAATPAASQTYPATPLFYVPTDVAVESAGMAEVRIIRGSPSSLPSTFHITTNDFSIAATAMWPADYPAKVDQTITIQPNEMIGRAMIPLAYHNSFQDTKVIAIRVEPVSNAEVDRIDTPLIVYDGNISHLDAWKPAAAFTENGYAQLRVDSDGYPKIETLFADKAKPNYTNMYPKGEAGEVWRVTGFGYSAVSNRRTIHAVKLNNSSRDGWFYQDDMLPVQPAVWLGDPTVAH